jgi:citrate synthase
MSEIARGLQGVVITESRMSRVRGELGELVIGGFELEELALHATFEEVLFLMWNDRLPNQGEYDQLRQELAANRKLAPITLIVLREAAAKKMPPMDALRLGVDTLSLVDLDPEDGSRAANQRRAIAIVAAMPSIVAVYWRLLEGQEPVEPDLSLGHAAAFLQMLTAEVPQPDVVRGLETYLNTVVDHGMNASTFTGRVIVSTRSDMYSAIVGAIGALKGPLHGGAPGPALDMVFELREKAAASGRSLDEEAEDYVRAIVGDGGRIMGFGHRVYKVRDPRADVLGAAAKLLFKGSGDSQLYEDALLVEDAVIRVLAELKPGRKLQTNVEFYTALLLHGIGLDARIFSAVFGVSRGGGWSANVLEQIDDDVLIRPRVLYTGALDRKWVPIEQRG